MKRILRLYEAGFAYAQAKLLDLAMRHGDDVAPVYLMRAMGVLVPPGTTEIEFVVQCDRPQFLMLEDAPMGRAVEHKCSNGASDTTDTDLQRPDPAR